MNHTCETRAVRWLWTGAWRALGVAGLLLGSNVWAQETCAPGAGSCTPRACGPSCQDCERIFGEAADRLKNLNPGGCATAPTSCAPTSCTPSCGPDCNQCQRIFEEAAAKLNSGNGCGAPAPSTCAPSAGCSAPEAVFNNGCGGGCGGGHGWLGGELGTPWSVMDHIPCAKERGWQIGGWTSYGYQNNPDGAFTGNGVFNNEYFGAGFNNAYEWDHFNLNQSGIYIGKVATVTDCKPIAFGGRVELMYGVDGNEFQSFGNNPGTYDYVNGWDHGIYEWALPQLYGEVAVGKLSTKIGHFYTPVGYEVLPNTGQFFMSRQLTFYNSEPFTHTGVYNTYTVNEKFNVSGGFVLGMDTGFNQNNGGRSFLGGFTYTPNDKTQFLNYLIAGNLGWRGDGFINSTILTHKWTCKLQSVHQFDVLSTNLDVPVGPFGFFTRPVDFARDGIARDSIGQINYLFYDLAPKVKLGLREEWYKADSVSYYTLTYGVNVRPVANFVVRPEVRHMWSPGADNTVMQPGRGDLFNQTVLGVDFVLSY